MSRSSLTAKLAILSIAAVGATGLWAQRGGGGAGNAPYDNAALLPYSPEVHPDRTLTLRLYAPNAKEVLLVGPTIVAALGGVKPLVKDDKGVWSITVGPLKPAIYSYGFGVDGMIRIVDPANPDVETRRWGPTSYVEIPGDPNRDYREVPHGTLHEHHYDSKSLNEARAFVVYTPPGYETSKAKYPVLYLLHGSTQIEESWSKVGGAQIILDNLLADNKTKPMIIVMPYGHVGRQMIPVAPGQGRGGRGGGGGASGGFAGGRGGSGNGPGGGPGAAGLGGGGGGGEAAGFEKDLLAEVLPVVDKNYRVLTGIDNRAIIGLSMGGGEAMLTGLHHPEIFGYIGGFSAQTNYRADMEKAGPDALNKYKLIWLGCGTEDPMWYQPNKAISQWLDKNNVKHVWREIPGAHVWPVWQQFLGEAAPLLFVQNAKK